jgi:predicted DNA-binding protein with PD1-like motif
VLLITVRPGEEIIGTVTRHLSEQGITTGVIVSVIGAVDSCAISNMPANDSRSDLVTEFSEPFEMSGTGEVRDGEPHIHCVVSGEGNRTFGGHLHRGMVGSWFVNVYVAPISSHG